MTDYLIGISKQLLFLIPRVFKIRIDEDSDSLEMYNKSKELIFFTNKMDIDFITKWNIGDEIPEAMQKIYSIPSETEPETEPGEPSTTEPTIEEPEETPEAESEPTE